MLGSSWEPLSTRCGLPPAIIGGRHRTPGESRALVNGCRAQRCHRSPKRAATRMAVRPGSPGAATKTDSLRRTRRHFKPRPALDRGHVVNAARRETVRRPAWRLPSVLWFDAPKIDRQLPGLRQTDTHAHPTRGRSTDPPERQQQKPRARAVRLGSHGKVKATDLLS